MNPITEARGDATHEEFAEMMSAALGRPITARTVQNYEKNPKRLPKSWRPILGVEELDASTGAHSQGASPVREGEPPRPPAGARETPTASPAPPSGDYSAVRDRIAKMYGAIGAGASMITHNEGYSVVASAYGPDLAAAWEAAAKENANVKRIVDFLESGGPVGELVVAHLILVGGFVYVSGRGEALGFLYAGKFERHHLAAAAARLAELEAAEAELNGSAPVDPSRLVGEPQG